MKNKLKLNIVYEDQELLVINKEPGILTHSDQKNFSFSLIDLIKENKINLSKGENKFRPGIVHRLDKDTSGLLILAKTDKAHYFLKKQFLNREIKKYYHAIVWGAPNPIAGLINIPITSFLNKRKTTFLQNAKEAITFYKTIKSFSMRFSLIECRILTGRTHQIRVHMLSKGCPLIGDKLYSKGRNISRDIPASIATFINSFKRQALHSTKIIFKHPSSNKLIELTAKKPKDFLDLEKLLFEN